MFPLWDIAIAPVLEAIGAKRVVEIGALRGETTVLMLDRLGPDAEFHVIDPAPEFDPAGHEERFPGRFIFHRDISHNVLPSLPVMDAGLIDGDHNWYTVYHELRMLAQTARGAGAPLPVFVMHDVGWPYGRRDLYYAPERIPDEFRRPYAQRGMLPERSQLVPKGRGGLSPTMFNALEEGGPRNGVMTALDDFEQEWDKPLRRVVLPIYFGLAIVAEQELVDRQPALARVLDRLESREGLAALLELGEQLRMRAMVFQHNVFYGRDERVEHLAHRYLDVLRRALGDSKGELPPTGVPSQPSPLAYLERCLDTVRCDGIAGDLVEVAGETANGAAFMRGYLEAYALEGRDVWVGDGADARTALDLVGQVDLADDRVHVLDGAFGAAPELPEQIALLRVDGAAAAAVGVILSQLYDRIAPGGFVVVDDADATCSREALKELRARGDGKQTAKSDNTGWITWRKHTAAPTD